MQPYVFCGLLAALAWGTYVFLLKLATIRKNRDNNPAKLFLGMAGSIFIVFLLAFLVTNRFGTLEHFSWHNFGLSSGSGILWAVGTVCVILALFDPKTSISRIVPLYNTNTFIVVLFGLLVLHESVRNPWVFALGAVCVVGGSILITWKEDDKKAASEKHGGVNPGQRAKSFFGFKFHKWIVYGVITSLSYSGYALMSKMVASPKSAQNDPLLISLEQSLGILLIALVYKAMRKNQLASLSKNGAALSFASGILWALGSLAILLAINRYGTPISSLVPLYNTNTLVSVILGMIVLHEVPSQRLFVSIGALLIVAGGILVVIN